MNWLSRAALLALPVIAGAWYFDHGQQSEQAQVLFQAAQSHAQNDQRLQTELASLTKSLAEKAALLAELETKQQTTSVERDGAKTALATAQQALKLATAEATSQSMELTKLTEALTVQRKAAAEQESALKTTLNSLRAEASQFKQTMEQQALETQNVLAKADAEKAAAIHEAAAAAGQVRELSAQLAQWMKDHPVVEPSAK